MVNLNYDALTYASIGGLILGLATTINYVIRGKVTGMSGIVFGIVSWNKSEIPQKLSIVGGMFLISAIFFLNFGYKGYGGFMPFGPAEEIDMWTSIPGFALAGFLVGFGTKLSNGCTSGHGLCGIPRLSIRSIVAVCTFLFTGIALSSFAYHKGLGPLVNNNDLKVDFNINHQMGAYCLAAIGILLPFVGLVVSKTQNPKINLFKQLIDQSIVFIVGVVFAIGLMVSGMSRRKNIMDFLQIKEDWNPALMCVLGCGLLVNFITFNIMRNKGTSLNGNKVFDPKNNEVDWKLIFGAFCFGLGWGLGGLCPGPFLVLFAVSTVPIQVFWGVGLVVGMLLANKVTQASKVKQQ